MHVLAEWPGALSVGRQDVASKHADDTSLGGLVQRVSSAAVGWEVPGFEAKVPVTRTNIWRHPEAHPLVLLMLVLDKYGQEGLEWELETLRLTLQRDGIELSQSSWTKLMAARVLLLSPSPWRQWNAFLPVCKGLSGTPPNFVYLEYPQLGELITGIDIMHIVDPHRETSTEVDKCVAAVLRADGIPYAPPPLSFAQRELDDPHLRCSDCEAEHRDDHDVRCITCGSTALVPIPPPFSGLRDTIGRLWRDRHQMPLPAGLAGLADDGVGNVTTRLLEAHDYAKSIRAAMAAQLRALQ